MNSSSQSVSTTVVGLSFLSGNILSIFAIM